MAELTKLMEKKIEFADAVSDLDDANRCLVKAQQKANEIAVELNELKSKETGDDKE